MASSPSAAKQVAIIYGTKGGMGDVGKFALIHAVKTLPLENIRVLAMSNEAVEGNSLGLDIDVKCETGLVHQQFKAAIEQVNVVKIDVESDQAELEIGNGIKHVDAVVACLGSRQSALPRWLGTGSKKLTSAMATQGVSRLVILSSMGIRDDFLPKSFIRVLWGTLLHTIWRSVRRDLITQETNVIETDQALIDYVLVRPVGLDPEKERLDTWKLLKSRDDGGLDIAISKSDVALFMLGEALAPTLHRHAVTIGSFPRKESGPKTQGGSQK